MRPVSVEFSHIIRRWRDLRRRQHSYHYSYMGR
jgi:hypothetical protein